MPVEPTQSLSGLRGLAAADLRAFAGRGAKAADVPVGARASAPVVDTSGVLVAGETPVDTSRVDTIRKALESGTYPVIPTRISDAIIAAGPLLKVRT